MYYEWTSCQSNTVSRMRDTDLRPPISAMPTKEASGNSVAPLRRPQAMSEDLETWRPPRKKQKLRNDEVTNASVPGLCEMSDDDSNSEPVIGRPHGSENVTSSNIQSDDDDHNDDEGSLIEDDNTVDQLPGNSSQKGSISGDYNWQNINAGGNININIQHPSTNDCLNEEGAGTTASSIQDATNDRIRKQHARLGIHLSRCVIKEDLEQVKYFFEESLETTLDKIDSFLALWKELNRRRVVYCGDYQKLEEAFRTIPTSTTTSYLLKIIECQDLIKTAAGYYNGWNMRVSDTIENVGKLEKHIAVNMQGMVENYNKGTIFQNAVFSLICPSKGGEIRLGNGSLKLQVPKNAVDEKKVFWAFRPLPESRETELTPQFVLEGGPTANTEESQDDIMKYSLPCHLGPSNTKFKTPVMLTLRDFSHPFPAHEVGAMSVYRAEINGNKNFQRVGSCFRGDDDIKNQTVTIPLDHFSKYIIGMPASSPYLPPLNTHIVVEFPDSKYDHINVFFALNDCSHIEELMKRNKIKVIRETSLYLEAKGDVSVTWARRSIETQGSAYTEKGVLRPCDIQNLAEKCVRLCIPQPGVHDADKGGPYEDKLVLKQNEVSILELPFSPLVPCEKLETIQKTEDVGAEPKDAGAEPKDAEAENSASNRVFHKTGPEEKGKKKGQHRPIPSLSWRLPTRLDVLKDILSQYPDDGQILKEIIQNAEDAGAQHVKFMYDEHEYNTKGMDIKYDALQFQGPALYAYNDAVFTGKDFANLLNIQHSSKREDRTKVGRFGRGFKSVFHMTEMPTLLSGSFLGQVNPYSDAEPLMELNEVLERTPDHIESFFGKFGFSKSVAKEGHYPGTIFRFPLRKQASELSETVYSKEKIVELIDMLEADSYMNLLFLKSLVSIEVYVREENDDRPEGVRQVNIQVEDSSVRSCVMQNFFNKIATNQHELVDGERRLTYEVGFKCSGRGGDEVKQFIVCNYYNAKKDIKYVQKLLEDPNLSYLPIVSVAMAIKRAKSTDGTTEGQLFCSLPLPRHGKHSPTGLPIHVSSFFVVSSNRSEIKWPVAGQNVSKMTKDLQWNRFLITELLPQAYAHLLQDATTYLNVLPCDIISTFPDIERVDEKWKDTLLIPFLKQVHLLSIFPTASTTEPKCMYVRLKDAVLCPPAADPETLPILVKLLNDAKMNPVCIPEHMMTAVKTRSPRSHVVEATPEFVCDLLHRFPGYKSYQRDDKLRLLKYLLSNNSPDDIHRLQGIQLLPLANQKFTEFNKDATKIYIATAEEKALYDPLSEDLDHKLKDILCEEHTAVYTQLTTLQAMDILTLLPKIFPPVLCKDKKVLKPEQETVFAHLTLDWCKRLWHFFKDISDDHPNHLDEVKHLHLLPLINTPTEVHLTRLLGGVVCIAAELHTEALPGKVSEALEYFGIQVLHDMPIFIRQHPFLFDDGYIHQPNAQSVLSALLKANEEQNQRCDDFNTKATSDQKKAFLQFLEPLRFGTIGSEEMHLLRDLELFETVAGSGNEPQQAASLSVVPNGVTSYTIPVKPNCKLLDLSSSDTLLMAEFIGVNILSETMIIEEYILELIRVRSVSAQDIRQVMLYVLRDFKTHSQKSDKIIGKLENLAFLEDEEGKYRIPSDFFDPSDCLLKQLFWREDKFPSEEYHDLLDPLRKLGLKKRSQVTIEDLNHSAELVHRDVQGLRKADPHQETIDIAKLKEKSQAIAKFLENPSLTQHGCQHLIALEWIPVQMKKPKSYPGTLAWNPETKMFSNPKSVALDTYTCLIASSMAIVDTLFVSNRTLETICGDCAPPCAKVIQHLKNISQCYSTDYKHSILEMVLEVYQTLQRDDPCKIQREFSAQNLSEWVWQGDGFTSVDRISIGSQFIENLTPYVFTLPPELAQISDWLSKMGVKHECNPVDILKRIQNWHEENGNISEERVDHDRLITVNLLNQIVESNPSGVPESTRECLLLPVESNDNHLHLLPSSACTYRDKEWEFGAVIDVAQVSEEDDETLNFLHRSISKATATALGVATLTNRLLEGDAEGFEFEGHGQEESLTHRLKLLLQDYPDGLAIPKELIQNADDAGATEIKFLFDERENEDAMTGLLDEGMKQCQGPALWIYNNAEFSAEDLANIRKLSGATKEDKKDKIGKFGLGFNAVYNVTDVPSFVTREYVVFFDPHRSHLGKAIPRNDTGLKVNLCTRSARGAVIRKQLFNQFKTYHGVFGCQMEKVGDQKPYPGTLFRLPLRKPGTVSEIKNVPYSRKDMVELLQLLLDKADELLLFTQNVKRIEVYHLPPDVRDPNDAVKLYAAEQNLLKLLKGLPSPPFPQSASEQSLLKVSQFMNADTPQQYPGGLHLAETVMTKIEYSECKTNAMGLKGKSRTGDWLLYGCVGLGKSFTLALTGRSEVPVASVAVKLCPDGVGFRPEALESAPVYCHLPLPSSVKSGLPVIVNGCFAVTPDRRHLVELTSDDKQCAMNLWNKNLQEDAVTEAYIGALELMTKHLYIQDDHYRFWPKGSRIENQFLPFYRSFYTCLARKSGRFSPAIFTNGKTWVDFQHAVFLDEILVSSELKDLCLNKMQQYLDNQSTGLVAIDLPMTMREEFGDLGDKTIGVTEFFKKAVLPCITKLDQTERDDLLRFGLKCSKNHRLLHQLLLEHNCIPLRPAGMTFSKPRDLISPAGQCSSLFGSEDGVFPTESFCGEEYLCILEGMGMVVNNISWRGVIERAKSVKGLPLDRAMERTSSILGYIEWKHKQGTRVVTNDMEELAPIRKVMFLPVLGRPKDYLKHLRWKGDEVAESVVAADELYLPKHRDLIGSTCLLLDDHRSGLQRSKSRSFLEKVLGLHKKKPCTSEVITQLKNVLIVDETSPWIKETSYRIYRFLNRCCQDLDESKEVRTELRNTRCILVDDDFMYPEHCAKKFNKEIPPLLSKIPKKLINYTDFLAALEVKASFEPNDFIDALHRISSARTDGELDKIRDIAECLHKELTSRKITIEEVTDELHKPVLLPSVPDDDSVWEMFPVKSLCLNLYPWLRIRMMGLTQKYVHAVIPPEVAKALGVKTDGENIFESLGQASGEPFGQREKLTTRIKNILEGYPCDEGILKELLQNADDAGASELRFILDTRTLGKQKIFHEKWKEMQGPALCVYNNSPFTSEDLQGISSLGQGSKSKDTTKTGQYGIGFNCVYHLTDVPSFLTDLKGQGKTLCLFDPNCTYVPGANEISPGRRFQGGNLTTVKELFPDMLDGYLEDRFDLNKATMFRFPLRTSTAATSSQISGKEVTPGRIGELMNAFKEELFHSMLFVNSVRCASLEQTMDKKNTYTVNASMSPDDQTALFEFNAYVKQVSRQLRAKDVQLRDIEYREVVYSLKITDSDGRLETWSVCQCIGFKNPAIPEVVLEAINLEELALLPRAGVAYRRNDDAPHRLFCFLPLPVKTQLPVHVNGHFALDSSRRNLWNDLDGKRNISYKQAWNTLLMEQVVPHAYVSLVIRERNCSVSQSHVDASALNTFYRMFPDMNKAGSDRCIETLCKAFYSLLASNNLVFLAVQVPMTQTVETRWFSVGQCVDGEAFFESGRTLTYEPSRPGVLLPLKQTTFSLRDILCRLGFNLLAVQVPHFIHKALVKVGAEVREVEPRCVLTFLYEYKDRKSCQLANLPVDVKRSPFRSIDNVVKLISYCYNNTFTNDGFESLEGLPLCVTYDRILREFASKTNHCVDPEFSSLFVEHPDKFLDASVFRVIPHAVIGINPRCVHRLTIERLVPFLETDDYRCLRDKSRHKWVPGNFTCKQRRWIQTLWQLLQKECGQSQEGMMKLDLLKDFCILPTEVSCGKRKEYYLYPLRDASCVVATMTTISKTDSNVQEILINVGVPILDMDMVSPSIVFVNLSYQDIIPQKLVSNVGEGRGILHALSSLPADALRGIKSENAWELVRYLSRSLKDRCTADDAQRFLALPIHQTANGNLVSLQNSCVYLVPKGMPKAGLDNWYSVDHTRTEQFIFVEDEDVKKMYKNIGCTEKTEVDLYVELLLLDVNFQYFFDDAERLQHLRYIKDRVLPKLKAGSQDRSVLLARLQELPFLKDNTKEFRCAKEYYSPLEPLFEAMETSFPPEIFHAEHWIKFLGECGLNRIVTGKDLVRYARKVEGEAKRSRKKQIEAEKDTEQKAMLICEKLPEQADEVLFQFKDIRFLPMGTVSQPLSDLHPQYCHKANAQYISFQESVFYSDCEYCWTVAKVLPQWLQFEKFGALYFSWRFSQPVVHFNQKIATTLGIRYPLPVDTVVTHCIHLSRFLYNQQEITSCVSAESVMKQMYTFFSDESKAISSENLKRLSQVPLIVVDGGKRLIYPKQVVVNIEDAIEPYLCALPRQLLRFLDFFNKIGVEAEVCCQHFMDVLSQIRNICIHSKENVKQLGPMQLQAAEKVIARLFNLILVSNKQLPEDGCLYLLSRSDMLERSSELVRVDKPGWEERGRIDGVNGQLLKLPESNRYFFRKGLEKLPRHLRPKKLSEICEEDIDESCKTKLVQNLDDIEVNGGALHIGSCDFNDGLKRILCHELEIDSMESFQDQWLVLEEGLANITIHIVDELWTVLKIKSGEKSQLLKGSKERLHNGILVKTSSDGIQVYTELGGERDITKDQRFIERFTTIVLDTFPNISGETKNFLSALFLWPKEEISRRLDDSDIPQLRKSVERPGPIQGKPIPVTLHNILKQDIGTFTENEIVGFKTVDRFGEGNENIEEFIYAKVISEAGSLGEGDAFKKLKVDIGHREVVVFASNLYKFHREWLISVFVDEDPAYDIVKIGKQLTKDISFAYKKLSAEERRVWLIRIISRWQPDNNPGQEEKCKQVLEIIKGRVSSEEEKMSKTKTEESEEDKSGYNVRQVFEYTAQRARENREHIQQQRKWLESNTEMSKSLKDPDNYDYFLCMKTADDIRRRGTNKATGTQSFYDQAYKQFSRRYASHDPAPDVHEAKRWLTQAKEDFAASTNDAGDTKQAYEWAIFKCYMAAEKALKAAYLTKDRDNCLSHDLVSMAKRLDDSQLLDYANQISRVAGDWSNLLYPARGALHIPHNQHGVKSYRSVQKLTDRLLKRVQSNYAV